MSDERAPGARRTRYHLATQHDGRGWMIIRLKELGAGWSTTAIVVECNLPEEAARLRLRELRAAEVLEPDYPTTTSSPRGAAT